MDAKIINKKLRGEADRKAKTYHLSETITKEFEKACEPYSASRVIEEMMKEYIESSKGLKRKAPRERKVSVKKN